jgi:hypothetical protein
METCTECIYYSSSTTNECFEHFRVLDLKLVFTSTPTSSYVSFPSGIIHVRYVRDNTFCSGCIYIFAQSVSSKRLGKHSHRATMEDVSQWTNVIARC